MSDVRPFEAEVSRVLDLVIHSLYKDREIFLRELISNSSDACDKLRYESLKQPELLGDDPNLQIVIRIDTDEGVMSITDNGIGMDHDDLQENLGTIARSGTSRFLEQIAQSEKSDVQLIGQFGVGFYSVFMVADKVIVRSRKAGQDQTWLWASNGRDGYSLSQADESGARGTNITLHFKDDTKDILDEFRVRNIVRTYSDHIAIPIMLDVVPSKSEAKEENKKEDEGEEGKDEAPREPEQINNASALWTRPKSEITDEQYREFYHHHAHAFDDPFARVHFNAEGLLSYTALLFVPSQKPFDLFDPKRRHGVKLYVKRVFIADDLEELLPRYLRFVSGIIDSEDLQLNVSRETLQHGAVISKIRKAVVKRIVDEIAKKAKEKPEELEASETASEADNAETFDTFWEQFGSVLKEGLYEDNDNRDRLLDLTRFRTTANDGWTDLASYIERMKEGQEAIFYITGDNAKAMSTSPQLEEARSKGVEVLLLDDPVDEFWIPHIGSYKEKSLTSLTKGDVDLSAVTDSESVDDSKEENASADQSDLERLIARLKLTLGEEVKDIRVSKRLRESAVCLVADAGGMDLQMERFLKQHNQLDNLSKRILEINGQHDLIKRMADIAKDEERSSELNDLGQLLLDQARIIEGETIPDPGAFSRRMSSFLARGVG